MPGDLLSKYSGATAAIDIVLNGLANGLTIFSEAVDNESPLYLDALISVTVETKTGVSGTGVIQVFVVGEPYPDTANQERLLLETFNANDDEETFTCNAKSIAAHFDYIMPPKWKIGVKNLTGADLSGSNNQAEYRGVYEQYT